MLKMLRLYCRYSAVSLRGQLQYRASFMLMVFYIDGIRRILFDGDRVSRCRCALLAVRQHSWLDAGSNRRFLWQDQHRICAGKSICLTDDRRTPMAADVSPLDIQLYKGLSRIKLFHFGWRLKSLPQRREGRLRGLEHLFC